MICIYQRATDSLFYPACLPKPARPPRRVVHHDLGVGDVAELDEVGFELVWKGGKGGRGARGGCGGWGDQPRKRLALDLLPSFPLSHLASSPGPAPRRTLFWSGGGPRAGRSAWRRSIERGKGDGSKKESGKQRPKTSDRSPITTTRERPRRVGVAQRVERGGAPTRFIAPLLIYSKCSLSLPCCRPASAAPRTPRPRGPDRRT